MILVDAMIRFSLLQRALRITPREYRQRFQGASRPPRRPEPRHSDFSRTLGGSSDTGLREDGNKNNGLAVLLLDKAIYAGVKEKYDEDE